MVRHHGHVKSFLVLRNALIASSIPRKISAPDEFPQWDNSIA